MGHFTDLILYLTQRPLKQDKDMNKMYVYILKKKFLVWLAIQKLLPEQADRYKNMQIIN